MRQPIPNDWDNETWTCVQIEWPDSPIWIALLNGWLSQFKRGWSWDETTGDLLEVINIGWLIWLKNQALTACNGTPVPGPVIPPEINRQINACFGVECEDIMPCIDISHMVRYNAAGQLEVLNGCCEWVAVEGTPAAPTSPPIEDDPGQYNDPPIVATACGGAAAIVNAIYAVARCMWDATDESPVEIPYLSDGWWKIVKACVPQYTLKDKYITEGVLVCQVVQADGKSAEEVFDDTTRQNIICRLAVALKNPGNKLTDEDFGKVDTAFNFETGLSDSAVFGAAANCLGKAQLSNIWQTGCLDDTQDCDCPEAPLSQPYDLWTTYAWKYVYDFRQMTAAPAHLGIIEGSWLGNHGIVSSTSTQYRRAKGTINVDHNGGTAKVFLVLVKLPDGYSYANDPTAYMGTHQVMWPNNFGASLVWVQTMLPVTIDGGLQVDIPALLNDHFNDANYACEIQAIAFAGDGTDPIDLPL